MLATINEGESGEVCRFAGKKKGGGCNCTVISKKKQKQNNDLKS